MFKSTHPFLLGVTALLCAAAVAPLALAAPDAPDAPAATVKSKPSKLIVKLRPKKITVIAKRRMDRAAPLGIKAVVIDEPNLQDGTISVVTERNEFATIATGMGTRFARGYQLAGLNNIHTGYTVRCLGAWDQDGFQYQATSVALGNSVRDTDVIARINAACQNIGKARKGGGFGQSLVTMIPPTALPKAVNIYTGESEPLAPSPIPASLVPTQTPPAPVSPATIPPQPGQLPASPQTVPALPTVPIP